MRNDLRFRAKIQIRIAASRHHHTWSNRESRRQQFVFSRILGRELIARLEVDPEQARCFLALQLDRRRIGDVIEAALERELADRLVEDLNAFVACRRDYSFLA